MRDPSFWWRAPGPMAGLLAPLGALYGVIAARRLMQAGERARVPVICIGNLTGGGAGKTPTAIAVARLLQAAGVRPMFLTRGYGGWPRRGGARGRGARPATEGGGGRGRPVFPGGRGPAPAVVAALAARPALAFAGIADPEKFFATLRGAGIAVRATQAFPDHHRFAAAEQDDLITRADRGGLALVTTEKDLARMQGDPALAALSRLATALPVALSFDDAGLIGRLLAAVRAA